MCPWRAPLSLTLQRKIVYDIARKNGVKTLERLIWFDNQEQCGHPQVTASAHQGHQSRTEKDEDQKKEEVRTGKGTETSQPTNLSEEKPAYSNTAIQEECTDKRPPGYGTQSGHTRQEKRISQRPPNVINP